MGGRTPATTRIFVSLSRADNDACFLLGGALTLAGFDVWFDEPCRYIGDESIGTLEQIVGWD